MGSRPPCGLLLWLVIGWVDLVPVPVPSNRANGVAMDTAISFLTKYGYLPEKNGVEKMAAMESQDELKEALLQMQKMADIPQTGIMDDATSTMMVTPRCGFPDNSSGEIDNNDTSPGDSHRKRRFAVHSFVWASSDVKIRINGWATSLGQVKSDRVLREAWGIWEAASGLSFKEVHDLAHIDLSFARGYHGDGQPFDGSGGVVAHAFLPLAGGDVHFDNDETFTETAAEGSKSLLSVSVHELGHALGLLHSNVPGSIMRPYLSQLPYPVVLNYDDIQAIQFLYGFNSNINSQGTDHNSFTTTTTTSTTTTTPRPPSTIRPYGCWGSCGNTGPTDSAWEPCAERTFDAITRTHDGSTYAFKGSWYVKLGSHGVEPGYPRSIETDWDQLPPGVDAAVYWPQYDTWMACGDRGESWCWVELVGVTLFIKNDMVYLYVNRVFTAIKPFYQFVGGLPNPLDAAFTLDDKTYFVKDSTFYVSRTNGGYYAEPSANWPSRLPNYDQQVLRNMNAAFQDAEGNNHFFVGDRYYTFDSNAFRLEYYGYSHDIGSRWLGCQ